MSNISSLNNRDPATMRYEHPDILCNNFNEWLSNARTGDRFLYYYGPHISGRSIGRLAFKEYEIGSVTLFQKRIGKDFAYWAERTSAWS